jgi:hypothetical protein
MNLSSFLSNPRTTLRAALRNRSVRFILLLFCFSAVVVGCGSIPKTSVPIMNEHPSLNRVDDSLFRSALQAYVEPSGKVNLNGLRSDTALTAYLRELAIMRVDVFTSRQAELAFWINAHNAYALDMLRSNGPVRNVSTISGFRTSSVVNVGGRMYSLQEIEHTIITNQFREPRAFFALYLGGKSMPRLSMEPYVEATLSEQLDRATRGYLQDSANCFLNRRAGTLFLPSYMSELTDQLEKASGTTQLFVKAFAAPSVAEYLEKYTNVEIVYLKYDWNLR